MEEEKVEEEEAFNQMEDYSDDEYIVRRKKEPVPMMVTSPAELARKSADFLEALRSKAPRIECFAHSSVAPFVANALSAVGAAPVFSEDSGEATQLAGEVDAVFVCIGTITKAQAEAVRAAVARANASQKPWALDPDDARTLSLRSYVAKELMRRYPSIIRGNPSEIVALSGLEAGDDAAAVTAASRLANVTRATVLMSGAVDRVCGENAPVSVVKNGTPVFARVAGVGAVQGALGAALLAVAGRVARYEAAVATSLVTSIAGELAASGAKSPGAFQTAFLDALFELKPADVVKRAKIEVLA